MKKTSRFEATKKQAEAELYAAVKKVQAAYAAPFEDLFGALARVAGVDAAMMAARFERYKRDSALLEMLDASADPVQLLTTVDVDAHGQPGERRYTAISGRCTANAPSARSALAMLCEMLAENEEKQQAALAQQREEGYRAGRAHAVEQIEKAAAKAKRIGQPRKRDLTLTETYPATAPSPRATDAARRRAARKAA